MAVKSLVSNRKTSISLMFCAALVVSGCDENGEFMFPQTGQAATNETAPVAGQNVQMVERDVEAPDAFQVSEDGLWDGRPSLGGVWVAHPDVSEPERVIIRNQANGTFVIGALFRRERENPGPALQVSSEAAAALEMLAGAPSELEVTALRREEVSETPVVEPVVEFEPPSGIVAAPIDAAPVDATPIDAAPIDVTPAMAPTTEMASVDADASVELPRLIIPDPIAAAAAAIDAAEAEMAPIPAPAAAPIAPPTPAVATSSLAKPFIQIGIFSVEANATTTANRMRAAGIVPTVLAQESQGRSFWRVIVGPASSEAERAELLRLVKADGFEDAYFVTN